MAFFDSKPRKGKHPIRKRFSTLAALTAAVVIFAAVPGQAHFGAIIPSDDIVTQHHKEDLALEIKFLRPMEMHYMEMEKPETFGVMHKGKKTDLTERLKPAGRKSPGQEKMWKSAPYTGSGPGT